MARASRALVATVPAADIKKSKIPKELKRISWQGSDEQLQKFTELVGKIRRGDISVSAQKAVLAESVAQLVASKKFGAAWKGFFKRYAGTDLVAVEFAQGLGIAELLAASGLPRMTDKGGDRMVIYEFVRLDKGTVGARFHLVDQGSYKGTIVKAVAPLKPLVDAKGGQESDTVLRMVTAGIPQHAQDLLAEAMGVQGDPQAPVRAEMAMLGSQPAVIRGTGPWARFPWPKGVDVRQPTGILNRLR